MRTLPLVPTHRYLVVLGDECAPDIAAPDGWRPVRLTTDGASAATVRYAQLPRLKELQIAPTAVALSVGGWDLLATGGDGGFAGAAREALVEHLSAALRELIGARIVVGAVQLPPGFTGDEPGLAAWRAEFDTALQETAGACGARFTDGPGGWAQLWEDL